MERIAALSTGTKLMLASGFLLFFDLFLTWQDVPQRFGKKFQVTASLDGWDRLGLVLGLVTLALVTLAVIRETDAELSPDVPWNTVALGLAAIVLTLALLKNVTDAHSAFAAYAGVLFAALAVVGAYLDRKRPPPEPKPIEVGNWKPRVRVASGPEPSNGPRPHATTEPEAPPAQGTSAQPTSSW
jgi:hypothetical protein